MSGREVDEDSVRTEFKDELEIEGLASELASELGEFIKTHPGKEVWIEDVNHPAEGSCYRLVTYRPLTDQEKEDREKKRAATRAKKKHKLEEAVEVAQEKLRRFGDGK